MLAAKRSALAPATPGGAGSDTRRLWRGPGFNGVSGIRFIQQHLQRPKILLTVVFTLKENPIIIVSDASRHHTGCVLVHFFPVRSLNFWNAPKLELYAFSGTARRPNQEIY